MNLANLDAILLLILYMYILCIFKRVRSLIKCRRDTAITKLQNLINVMAYSYIAKLIFSSYRSYSSQQDSPTILDKILFFMPQEY